MICDNLDKSGIVAINTDLEYRVFNIISFCSVVGSCLVFLTGIWNPKLSAHPYKLVSMIALIDATYFLIFNTIDEVCSFKLQTIFAYTVYFDGSAQSQYNALVFLLKVSLTTFKALFIVSFFLNSFLCIDLYLTVKSPFTPAESRLKIYYGISFLIGFITAISEAFHYRTIGDDAKYAEELTILIAFLLFVFIAIPVTIFASRRILRKGVS